MKKEAPMKADEDRLSELKARVIRMADERSDFVQLEDGYVYYAPTSGHGALPPWALRALANEIDKRNSAWDAIIQGDHRVGSPCVQVWKWDDAPEGFRKVHVVDGDEDWLALVPKVLMVGDEPELWWMRWYPFGDVVCAKRYTQGVPEGFEIWVGCRA
jgi:hypothetical protein